MSMTQTLPEYLRSLYALWNTKRGLRVMPSRRDFATADLEPWLNEMHLIAVRPEGLRFIVFAAGPAVRYGTEMTGRYVADLQPSSLAFEVERSYLAAVETRSPVFGVQETRGVGGEKQTWSRMILPLSDDGLAVDRLLVTVCDNSTSFGAASRAAQALLVSKWTLAEIFEGQGVAVPSPAMDLVTAAAA